MKILAVTACPVGIANGVCHHPNFVGLNLESKRAYLFNAAIIALE